MKVNLISFQDKAVKDLRVDIADALDLSLIHICISAER